MWTRRWTGRTGPKLLLFFYFPGIFRYCDSRRVTNDVIYTPDSTSDYWKRLDILVEQKMGHEEKRRRRKKLVIRNSIRSRGNFFLSFFLDIIIPSSTGDNNHILILLLTLSICWNTFWVVVTTSSLLLSMHMRITFHYFSPLVVSRLLRGQAKCVGWLKPPPKENQMQSFIYIYNV